MQVKPSKLYVYLPATSLSEASLLPSPAHRVTHRRRRRRRGECQVEVESGIAELAILILPTTDPVLPIVAATPTVEAEAEDGVPLLPTGVILPFVSSTPS